MLLPADNRLDLSLSNAYLWAGLIAFAIAWRWKNLLLTIVAGMGLFLLWRVIG
jgi:branched-subunit amino acid transport protein